MSTETKTTTVPRQKVHLEFDAIGAGRLTITPEGGEPIELGGLVLGGPDAWSVEPAAEFPGAPILTLKIQPDELVIDGDPIKAEITRDIHAALVALGWSPPTP